MRVLFIAPLSMPSAISIRRYDYVKIGTCGCGVFRAGAHSGKIHEVLACYRARPGSASFDGRQMMSDGLRVITLGHAPDPRVRWPVPAYANGLPQANFLPPGFSTRVGLLA